MSHSLLAPAIRPAAGLRPPRPMLSADPEDLLADIAPELFASLRRSDQRRKAEQYVRGLLQAEGRKSMRNIAALAGGHAAVQSLHHFIASSTWDWLAIRQDLSGWLERRRPPRAWVIQSLPIPKAGRTSVGVERRYVRELGQMLNSQHAFGLWFATPDLSVPVNWRLVLSDGWLEDVERRRRGEIPECAVPETPERAAALAAVRVREWGATPRPVVVDARTLSFRGLARELGQAELPLLALVNGEATRVAVAAKALPGYGAGAQPARHIVESVSSLRRPVEYHDPASGAVRSCLAVGVPVLLPATDPQAPGRVLLLVGEWRDPKRAPRTWLTDLVSVPLGSLLRTAHLLQRAELDMEQVGARVGLRDFTGRSFHGWHRHMTLAGVAHAVTMVPGPLRTDDWYAVDPSATSAHGVYAFEGYEPEARRGRGAGVPGIGRAAAVPRSA